MDCTYLDSGFNAFSGTHPLNHFPYFVEEVGDLGAHGLALLSEFLGGVEDTWPAAEAVSATGRLILAMFALTPLVPVAAWSMFRAISEVAALCSSTTAVTVVEISPTLSWYSHLPS